MLWKINDLLIPPQSLWLVCALFYLLDNIRTHSPRNVYVCESYACRWHLLSPVYGYRIGGRSVTLFPPWFPFLAITPADWLTVCDVKKIQRRKFEYQLAILSRRLLYFRILAIFYFSLLFLLGPALTHVLGLIVALSIIIPLHIVGIVMLGILLFRSAVTATIPAASRLALLLECLICPGFYVNILRRISLASGHPDGDAVANAIEMIVTGSPHKAAYQIRILIDDYLESSEPTADDILCASYYQCRLSELAPYE